MKDQPLNLEELVKSSIEEYINLCDRLMEYINFDYQEKTEWIDYPHGRHIRYIHKATGQVVEAPLSRIKKREDVDPYFWNMFIKSTNRYKSIESYLNQTNSSLDEILNPFLDERFFENRDIKIPEIEIGDFLQLRASAFIESFNSKKYWDSKYYYEDRISHIYWPMEQNFKNYGSSLPTVLGSAKTQVKKIIMNSIGISKIYTDLFIIDMPMAYESNQFKLIDPVENYTTDERISQLIEQLSFFEQEYKRGIFRPYERENNKQYSLRMYFETMKNKIS